MSEELKEKIIRLKAKRNAVVLSHNYQLPEVQDIADFVGDSLGLSIEASKTTAEIIVFCGVHFMAETAKILNPQKTVLMPDPKAGCPMANMITAQQLKELKSGNPKAKVVCYVNTTAQVKAESDMCCTSGNAVEIVRSLGAEEVIFVPDQYLGNWVERNLNRKLILWHGFCNIHTKILPQHIIEKKKLHPLAKVLAHPECSPAVIDLADKVVSTSGMVKYPGGEGAPFKEFIIATEAGILHQLRKYYPDRFFYPAFDGAICPNMKLTSLEKVLWGLEDLSGEINVDKEIARKARVCIERMLKTA